MLGHVDDNGNGEIVHDSLSCDKSFEQQYTSIRSILWPVIRHRARVLGFKDAEMLLDDVLFYIYMRFDSFCKRIKPGKMEPYLRAVCRRYVLDLFKQKKRTQKRESALTDEMLANAAIQFSNTCAQTSYHDLLREKIATLPQEQRTIIRLKYYQEYTYRQIGEVLDVAIGTVCDWHRDLLESLRQLLSEEMKQ